MRRGNAARVAPLLAVLLLACKAEGECVPFAGGEPMPMGWVPWMDTQRAEFAISGECPDAPPETAVWADGCAYEVDATVLQPQRVEIRNRYNLGFDEAEPGTTGFHLTFRESEHTAAVSRYGGAIDWLGDVPGPAPLFHGGGGAAPYLTEGPHMDDFASSLWMYGDEGTSVESEFGYAWVCLDVLEPAEREGDGAAASGAAFFHVEAWADDTLAPGDYFFLIEHNDEAYAEDASGRYDEYGAYWPADCDGVDNDMDGEVDEFADDCDGNGVADCLEYETEDAPACD